MTVYIFQADGAVACQPPFGKIVYCHSFRARPMRLSVFDADFG